LTEKAVQSPAAQTTSATRSASRRAEPHASLEARDTATCDHDKKLSRADHLRASSHAVF